MGIVIFFLLALIAAGAIAYPLLPGRATTNPETAVTDGDIDRAVRHLRRARSKGGHSCPVCGRAHQPGDQFCARCGAALPESRTTPAGPVCPSCGAAIHKSDQFCAKCGHQMTTEEVA
jgi:uncharacterized OB-fold protein